MKDNKIEKFLTLVAKASCDSTSCICFYEPKVPEKLAKKEIKKLLET